MVRQAVSCGEPRDAALCGAAVSAIRLRLTAGLEGVPVLSRSTTSLSLTRRTMRVRAQRALGGGVMDEILGEVLDGLAPDEKANHSWLKITFAIASDTCQKRPPPERWPPADLCR